MIQNIQGVGLMETAILQHVKFNVHGNLFMLQGFGVMEIDISVMV